jgi:cholesterol transport system auxiliary component
MGPPASLPLPKLRSGAFKRLAPAVVLALAAAACGSGPAPTTYDLSAPRAGARFGGAVSGQIVVSEPTAIQTLEAE